MVFWKQKLVKNIPGRHERVFAVDAPAVRPGRLRVRVVVEVETLLVRWFHPGHLRGHLFNSIRAQSHS